MKTAEEIGQRIFNELDDFSRSIISPQLLIDCVQAGMDELQPAVNAARHLLGDLNEMNAHKSLHYMTGIPPGQVVEDFEYIFPPSRKDPQPAFEFLSTWAPNAHERQV